jgi:penicillin-binding protein 1A
MVQGQMMTEGQVIAARRNPASVVDREDLESPDYFLDWAFEEVKRIGSKMRNHSLVVRTTIDLDIQRAAEEAIEFHLRQHGQDYDVSQAAAVIIENNGAVRSIVGGQDYGESQFNRATHAKRQAGSSFKPYVYATAMENGFTPKSRIRDEPVNWAGWRPQNYTRRYVGRTDLTTALVKSYNTVPVRLVKNHLKSTKPVKDLAIAMGVESDISRHKTMVLGTFGMTVMDQATGYSVFASGGMAGMRHGITQILSQAGEILYDHSRDRRAPRRVLSEGAAVAMNSILVQIPEWGTGRRAALPMTRAAGKTGTTQSYRDAWFVGFTGNYTAAVWFGNDDFTPTKRLTGGSLPAMTWQRMMSYAHQNIELKPIPGIEETEPSAEIVSRARNARAKIARSRSNDIGERPLALSGATVKLLQGMTEQFRDAPVLTVPDDSTKVSALAIERGN